MAAPFPLCDQLPQVRSSPAGKAVPSGWDPVRMSCMFGVSPRPLTGSPFSVSAVCLLMLFWPCSSARSFAMMMPLAFTQGPRPMRSRALTAPGPWLLRYARQVFVPATAVAPRSWQSWSAPARPPRLPPFPGPALVMKKLISDCCAWPPVLPPRDSNSATDATIDNSVRRFILVSLSSRCEHVPPRPSQGTRGQIDRQGEERGVEHERHDAVRGRGPADQLAGDGDIGHLRRHADDERKVDEIPVVGLAIAREGQASAVGLIVELVSVVEREDRVNERPGEQDREGRESD